MLRGHREVLLVHAQQHRLQQIGARIRRCIAVVIFRMLAIPIRLLAERTLEGEQFVVTTMRGG